VGHVPYELLRKPSGNGKVIGCFRSKETDNFFEFSDGSDESPWVMFPHLVWFNSVFKDKRDSRFALVKKTVVEVVVDEKDNGDPITEKWSIKQYKNYRETFGWVEGKDY
jgi:hypothetical protein